MTDRELLIAAHEQLEIDLKKLRADQIAMKRDLAEAGQRIDSITSLLIAIETKLETDIEKDSKDQESA